MKYKIGDRVKIKKDKEIARDVVIILQKIDRIVTIKKVLGEHYIMEEVRAHWPEDYVEELELSTKEFFSPMINRFELMEL